MARWVMILAVVWGLVWQPVLSLRLEPGCCRAVGESAVASECCAEVAAALCEDVGAVVAVEDGCGGCCSEEKSGGAVPGEDGLHECATCVAVCALVCGNDWGSDQGPSRPSGPAVDGGVDWPGAVSVAMALPRVEPGARRVERGAGVPLSVGERLSRLCVRTT